jgi:hypothetical protein
MPAPAGENICTRFQKKGKCFGKKNLTIGKIFSRLRNTGRARF